MRSIARVSAQIFCLFQLFVQCNLTLQHREYFSVRNAEFGVEYKQIIDHNLQQVWRYRYDGKSKLELPGDTFVVRTQVDQQVSNYSLVTFEVRHFHQSIEWSLPLKSKSGRVYMSANRTLCTDHEFSYPGEDNDFYEETAVQVSVSTRSKHPVPFTLEVEMKNNTLNSFGKVVKAQISPLSQDQYRVVVKQNALTSRYSLLYITSNDDICSTVSIMHSSCSTTDQFGDFGRLGLVRSQRTMTKKAAINLKREDLSEGNLLLTFTVHEDSSICGVPKDNDEETTTAKNNSILSFHNIAQNGLLIKTVEFSLIEKIGDDVYLSVTFGTFLLLLLFCIVFTLLFRMHLITVSGTFHSAQQHQDIPCEQQPTAISITATTLPPVPIQEQIQDEDLCCMFFLVPTSYPQQSKYKRTLQDSCKKCARDIAKRTRRYVSTLSVVAAFYALPVFQFVLLYQQVLNDTGNEDLCYYNFMCLHPLGNWKTFNHMYSNLGYVMLGLLFIYIVYVKQTHNWLRDDEMGKNPVEQLEEEERGLHSHYGIFYAMGVALTMEGLMSAFYHVCPNRMNYQFDVCFMYVTTMLCLVKLYQGRHPDNCSALMAYGSLAMVAVLAAAGVFLQAWYFWCAITFVHFAVIFFMSLHLYSFGNWRIGWPALSKSENTSYILSSICYPFRQRINWVWILLVLVNITNWFGAGIGYMLFFASRDIASHLVFILLINLFLYSILYLSLKIKFGEKIRWPTRLYLALSLPCWFIGLYLFIFRRVDGWNLSQSESRILNENCTLWSFYDRHDMWHFFSAFGIFFMFMFFLTLDDDLTSVNRTNIKVF